MFFSVFQFQSSLLSGTDDATHINLTKSSNYCLAMFFSLFHFQLSLMSVTDDATHISLTSLVLSDLQSFFQCLTLNLP